MSNIINKEQMLDIAAYISALEEAEKIIESREFDGGWGDGLRAQLPKRILIESDLGWEGVPAEKLGYIVREDLGWRFSTDG